MRKSHVIVYLLVVLMFCCGKEKKKSVIREPLAAKKGVEIKAPDKHVIKRFTTIKDYWPMFQKAVEHKDRETILKLIKVILHEDISEIIKHTTYGLERVNWDIGLNLPSDKPIYYINAIGHIKDIKEGMPDNFTIQLFFGEVDGEYRLFHQLYAG